jgi:hypothetical protein
LKNGIQIARAMHTAANVIDTVSALAGLPVADRTPAREMIKAKTPTPKIAAITIRRTPDRFPFGEPV